MTTAQDHLLILTTAPDAAVAQTLAQAIVGQHMAACVNLLPKMTSIYPWQGKINVDHEHLLLIKTHRQSYPALESYLLEHHPYELPEIIAVPIQKGLKAYLTWISENTTCTTET